MGLVSKNFTFSAGATIVASEHNSNADTLYNLVNGNLDNANISGSAAIAYSKLALTGAILNADLAGSIADSKLSQITTASKVSGTAITGLASTPSAAGVIPLVNLASGTATSSFFIAGDQVMRPITVTKNTDYSFSAYNSGNVVTSGATPLKLTFDTEDFDTGGNFSSSTFTAPVTGKYLFTLGLSCGLDGTGTVNTFQAYVYVNGSQKSVLDGLISPSSTATHGMGGSIILSLSATDTIDIYITRLSGSVNLNIFGGSTLSRFTGCYLT